MKNICIFVFTVFMLTACQHKVESVPEGGLKFEEELAIKEPVVLRNAFSKEGKIVYEALEESGYFTKIHREDDEVKTSLEFDIKLERENVSNGAQKASSIVSLMTLGVAPSNVSFNYTLNTGVWKDGKFVNRYKPTVESSNTIVAWQIVTAEEKSLIKRLLPEMLRQLKKDLANK